MRLMRSAVAGMLAGAAGTMAMDLTWYLRYRNGGGDQAFVPWETSAGTTGFEEAAAPARTAKAIADQAGVELPEASARALNNAVHWMTGLAWGQAHGIASWATGVSNPMLGLGTAVMAWATSYVVLPRLGVYQKMSEYEIEVLWKDLSAHLVFGTVLGLVFRLASNTGD
jgi:hypothetical protein